MSLICFGGLIDLFSLVSFNRGLRIILFYITLVISEIKIVENDKNILLALCLMARYMTVIIFTVGHYIK